MRSTTRKWPLLAALLAIIAILGVSAPAGAAEGEAGSEEEIIHEAEILAEENGGTEFDAHCIEILAEGGSVDDCQAAPNPILPETNEIIWGAFGFLVVFLFFLWKGYPAIKKAMNDRTEKIRGDLAAAEASREEADQVLAGYNTQLAEARQESARILEESRQDADAVRSERIAAIDGEIAEIRQRAAAEAEASKAQALSDLRGEVTALALGAAERVIEANLDDATNRALIDSYIDSVGANS
jgi:F-type H+-transporting ATPase subunit b